MNGKQATFFLTLSFLLVFIIGTPVFAQVVDDDGDGVPTAVENNGLYSFSGNDGERSDVATFPSATDPDKYMTLFIEQVPFEPLRSFINVEAIESPAGTPLSPGAVLATPLGFIRFEVSGASNCDPVTVTLILHDTFGDDLDLVRYSPTICSTASGNTSYCYPGTNAEEFDDVGTIMFIYLEDGQLRYPPPGAPGLPECSLPGVPSFIGAPVYEERVDTDEDEDGVLIFEDNCPNTANPDQIDSDDDGMGDVCDACPLDPDNDIDGDGICGDVDNCPAVSNSLQADANRNDVGDACDSVNETTVYSYIGKKYWRFFRDYDIWEIEGKAGQHFKAVLRAVPEEKGFGKRLNLILLSRTRGARLLRMDFSPLDPDNTVEAIFPKDGKYWIVVGQSWRARKKAYRGIYDLNIRGSQKTIESLRATRSVGKWWR